MNLEQLRRGIEEFNNRRFFEAHDTLEDLWRETSGHDKLFLQGLIQVSVGYYHLLNLNYKGAVSQFSKGLAKLSPYLPAHRGVELEEFHSTVTEWYNLAEVLLNGGAGELDEEKVPKILYQPEISII